MKIPTDPIEAAIFGVNLALAGIAGLQAYDKLAHGITAQAQAEGRDVDEDERRLINALLAESAKQRKGG